MKKVKETLLKKEFTEKAVTRLRNLVAGKYGDKINKQVGFTQYVEDKKEGDVWEENGKKWTIKNGLKQNITKLDNIKSTFKTPMWCPECKCGMKLPLDKKMYTIHRKCSKCVIEMESEMKRNGTYEQYALDFSKRNISTHIDEAHAFIDEFAKSSVDNFITEDGDVEETIGDINKNKMLEQWHKELDEMKELISKN